MNVDKDQQLKAFEVLKQQLVAQLQAAYPGCKSDIKTWTGREVEFLQKDLQVRVNGRISERWFYNYLKPEKVEKLPRIDMLDLLANYVGSENWERFVYHFTSPTKKARPTFSRKKMTVLSLVAAIALIFVVVWYALSSFEEGSPWHQLTLSAPNNLQNQVLEDARVQLLLPGESPKNLAVDSINRVTFNFQGQARIVVSGPYLKTDTITRNFSGQRSEERLVLEPDNYALLIHYLSSVELSNWQEKEKQLQQIFIDQAQIYQVMPGSELGMDLYNKEQFIRKLVFPGSQLKNMEVLDVVYTGDRISKLKFVRHE